MGTKDFLPTREPELVTWIQTFQALISTNFADYGLTTAQATGYGTLADGYIAAYNLAKADATRSPSAIIAKDDARALVTASTRQLAGIIQKFPGTTNEMRSQLGLTVPAPHTPIGIPPDAPVTKVTKRSGTNVQVQLQGVGTERRGKPKGVQGARIYSHIGPTAPVNVDEWLMQGQSTRTLVDIPFPADTAPGTLVWICCCWYNPRGETGPACQPISAYIAGGDLQTQEVA